MRLLFLSSIYPRPDNLTRGIFCYHLCRALAAQHEVRVVSPRSWLEWLRNRSGKTVRRRGNAGLAPNIQYPRYYHPPRVLLNARGWFMWQSVKHSLKSLLRTYRPDCILSYWSYPDGEVANRAAGIAGIPSVVMVGGSDVLLGHKTGTERRVAAVLCAAHAVVTIGKDLRDKVVAMGVRPDHVFAIQRGVDAGLFCPGDAGAARKRLGIPYGIPMLLWVGRMAPVKGLTVLLEACARLRASGIQFRLYLLGDGDLRRQLRRTCDESGLAENVQFVGIRSHDQLPDWYRAADLTVLPSLSEGVPNVLRESLACGTPFVASRVGGIPEISNDPANCLVPPGDPVALAEALNRALLERPKSRLAMKLSLSWSDSATLLLDIIRQFA